VKTLIDIDDELLAQAREVLQTSTKKDTVNGALAEVVALARRRALLAELTGDGLPDLLDEKVMSAAWQR
jgi:Arc/MetJ family transcription regulator